MTFPSGTEQQQRYEVADIFRQHGEGYRSKSGMTRKQCAVMQSISNCRTPYFGYHIDQCDACGHIEPDFNSCRDRHCPKCQGVSRKKWINARLKDILPVPYYHAVFTLPHLLHDILQYNREFIYELLFSNAADTLLTFGRDPKWLGGEIGFYGILHTWGQKLWQHAHIHFIVPGGALTKDGRWVEPKYASKFLFPVHALSKVFRGKFIEGLKKSYYSKELVLPPDLSHLESSEQFESWLDKLVAHDWVVYCKRPFGDAEQVVRYIGRYTHRVAISNQRIISVEDGEVCFWYKDYKAKTITWKKMALKAREFIRRFMWHVLPEGFHKIRHFGFLSNGRCKSKVAQIRSTLADNFDICVKDNEEDYTFRCPECDKGKMSPLVIINRFGRIFKSPIELFINGYAFDTS